MKFDERDPDDDRARRGGQHDRPPQHDPDVVGQRVAAEQDPQIRAGCDGIDHQQAKSQSDVAAAESTAAIQEWLDPGPVRAAQHLQPQRRPLDRSGVRFSVDEHRDGPALDHKREDRASYEDDQERQDEGRQRGGIRAKRAEYSRHDLERAAAQNLLDVGLEEQDDEEQATDHWNAENDLQSGLGDELDRHERPVGRRDERAPLQRDLEPWSVRHRQDQFTFAVSCFTSASPEPSRPARELAPSARERSRGCRARGSRRRCARAVAVRGVRRRGGQPRRVARARGIRSDDRRADGGRDRHRERSADRARVRAWFRCHARSVRFSREPSCPKPASRRHCGHRVRRHGPRARLERPALRHPARANVGRAGPLRPAFGPRPAPRSRASDHRRRLPPHGHGRRRARAFTRRRGRGAGVVGRVLSHGDRPRCASLEIRRRR